MNIEDYRDYCLSPGADIEEKLPFNLPSKYWLGIDSRTAPDTLLRDLTRNSYELVKTKYSKRLRAQKDKKDL